MRICIIGGTGTLSTPITKLLSENKENHCVLINRGKNLAKIDQTKVEVWCGDINDEILMQDYLENQSFDVVINFINYTPDQIERDIRYFKHKTKQYIFISTNVVLNHVRHCVVDETMEVGNPTSVYGQQKALCEARLIKEEDFPYTIIRPSHTYSDDRFPVSVKGQGTWSVVHQIMTHQKIIMHDFGQAIWPITHAKDFARLFVSVVGNQKAYNEIYHIMNPTPLTWDMIYQKIADITKGTYKPVYIPSELLATSTYYPYKESILGDKAFSNLFKIDKILALNPGFEFEIDLKQGIIDYLNYMDDNPHLKIIEDDYIEASQRMVEQYEELKRKFAQDA